MLIAPAYLQNPRKNTENGYFASIGHRVPQSYFAVQKLLRGSSSRAGRPGVGSDEVRVVQRSSAALNLELRHLKSRLYRWA